MFETPTTRVKRGVALLDEKVPDWAARIDLDELNMSDCLFCVLGQVFADGEDDIDAYPRGLETMGLKLGGMACSYGFDAQNNAQYDKLKTLWTRVIKARQVKIKLGSRI